MPSNTRPDERPKLTKDLEMLISRSLGYSVSLGSGSDESAMLPEEIRNKIYSETYLGQMLPAIPALKRQLAKHPSGRFRDIHTEEGLLGILFQGIAEKIDEK